MSIVKVGILAYISTSVKLASNLLLNKILAIYAGPEGYAVVGQLQNFILLVSNFGGTSLSSGVTKYISKYHNSPEIQSKYFYTSINLSIILSYFSISLSSS